MAKIDDELTDLASGLEHLEDLAVDALKVGGVDGGLDGVDCRSAAIQIGWLLQFCAIAHGNWAAPGRPDDPAFLPPQLLLILYELHPPSPLTHMPCPSPAHPATAGALLIQPRNVPTTPPLLPIPSPSTRARKTKNPPASKLPSPNCSESFIKSPLTKLTLSLNPALRVFCCAREIWKSLLFRPVMYASVKRAISRAGPPTPQPTSKTRMPGLISVMWARKCSWRASWTSVDGSLAGRVGAEWVGEEVWRWSNM